MMLYHIGTMLIRVGYEHFLQEEQNAWRAYQKANTADLFRAYEAAFTNYKRAAIAYDETPWEEY